MQCFDKYFIIPYNVAPFSKSKETPSAEQWLEVINKQCQQKLENLYCYIYLTEQSYNRVLVICIHHEDGEELRKYFAIFDDLIKNGKLPGNSISKIIFNVFDCNNPNPVSYYLLKCAIEEGSDDLTSDFCD